MLSLINGLDSTVQTDIGELPINLSYNSVLRWYEMNERDDMNVPAKIEAGWFIFIGSHLNFNTVHDFEVAAKALTDVSDYISVDPYVNANQDSLDDMSEQSPAQWYSYSQDAEAIYASFMFDYQIDLIDQQNKLRWEKFRALFNNLSPKSPMMRIIDIRQRDTTGLEGQALADLTQAQQYYALEGQSTDELNNSFGDMFSMLKLQAEQNK